MWTLQKFEAENFIGFWVGLNEKRIRLDFSDYKEDTVFILKTGNGKGKTTLLSIIHPLPHATDDRSKIIRKGKNGLKKLVYTNHRGDELSLKITYTANKTGHTINGYATLKQFGGDEEDLNPKGNIGEYKRVVYDVMGIDKDFLALTSHNDTSKDIVSLTSEKRRSTAFSIIKGLEEYTPYQKIIGSKFKKVSNIMNSLVNKLGKMKDEDEIEGLLKDINKDIDVLGEARDEALKVLGSAKDILDKYPADYNPQIIKRDIANQNLERMNLNKEMSTIQSVCGGTTYNVNVLGELLSENKIKLIKAKSEMSIHQVSLDNLEQSMLDLEVQIEKLKTSINDNSENSLESITQRIDEYHKELKEFSSQYKWLETKVTKEDILNVLRVQTMMREGLESILGFHTGNVHSVLLSVRSEGVRSVGDKLANEDVKLHEDIENANRLLISKESEYADLTNRIDEQSEILKMRPKNCVDDNCPFITESIKYTRMSSVLDGRAKIIENISKEIEVFIDQRADISERYEILKGIMNFFAMIDSIQASIDRLPRAIQITKDGVLDALIKSNYEYFNKDFESYINIIERKNEFDVYNEDINELIQRKKFIESNKELFLGGQDRINLLTKELEEKSSRYRVIKNQFMTIESGIKGLESTIDNLEKLSSHSERLKEIESRLKDIDESQDRLRRGLDSYINAKVLKSNAESEIKSVERQLKPLSGTKLMHVHDQMKVKEYKTELKVLEDDMSIIKILKESVSAKGMPTLLIDFYMEDVRQIANTLLMHTFNGALYLEEFIIDEGTFEIPYRKNGELGPDISNASKSERAFIRLAISLALYEVYGSDLYGTVLLDEIDGGLDDENIAIFVNILLKQVERVGMSRIFVITHNYKHYRNSGYVTINFKSGKNDVENMYLIKD